MQNTRHFESDDNRGNRVTELEGNIAAEALAAISSKERTVESHNIRLDVLLLDHKVVVRLSVLPVQIDLCLDELHA